MSKPCNKCGNVELTNRDKDIARQLATAKSDKQIAFEMGLQHGTVKVYVSKLYSKTGANKAGNPRVFIVNLIHEHPEMFAE